MCSASVRSRLFFQWLRNVSVESILKTFSKEYGQFSYTQKITVQMTSHPCLMKPLSEKSSLSEKSFQSTTGKAEMRNRLKKIM